MTGGNHVQRLQCIGNPSPLHHHKWKNRSELYKKQKLWLDLKHWRSIPQNKISQRTISNHESLQTNMNEFWMCKNFKTLLDWFFCNAPCRQDTPDNCKLQKKTNKKKRHFPKTSRLAGNVCIFEFMVLNPAYL